MPLPGITLTFLPKLCPPVLRKRGRAAADIDGEHSCLHKKKRRLRLFLITSRLSPQFSHPATNIVDRGSSKIAVWTKQKNLGRNLLRKAAILNRMRRSAVAAREEVSRRRLLVEQEKEQRQLEMARLTFNYGAIDTYTRPVHLQPNASPPAAFRNNTQYLVGSSPTGSQSGSPATSRSPSPSSGPPSTCGLGSDNPTGYRSPNAAYALSPPRVQSSIRSYEPHLPSPLGLSNYDAFDAENLGSKDHTVLDPYSQFDDEEEDRYSYLWEEVDDELEDERHDSPFSPSVVTNDSRSTANTGMSRILKTPPQTAHNNVDISETFLARLEEDEADSVWPSPFLGAGADPVVEFLDKSLAKVKRGAGGASPNFPTFSAEHLAVQYPGAPVPCAEQLPVTVPSVMPPYLAPASMSPNFLPADAGGWPGFTE
ncbi:hypothetical protein N0V86_008103 [Didymella sp. IMI 355093]|nr:hypothetical protein N0V86_008103 [Didymella sp. IMI 355093]